MPEPERWETSPPDAETWETSPPDSERWETSPPGSDLGGLRVLMMGDGQRGGDLRGDQARAQARVLASLVAAGARVVVVGGGPGGLSEAGALGMMGSELKLLANKLEGPPVFALGRTGAGLPARKSRSKASPKQNARRSKA